MSKNTKRPPKVIARSVNRTSTVKMNNLINAMNHSPEFELENVLERVKAAIAKTKTK